MRESKMIVRDKMTRSSGKTKKSKVKGYWLRLIKGNLHVCNYWFPICSNKEPEYKVYFNLTAKQNKQKGKFEYDLIYLESLQVEALNKNCKQKILSTLGMAYKARPYIP